MKTKIKMEEVIVLRRGERKEERGKETEGCFGGRKRGKEGERVEEWKRKRKRGRRA